MTTIMSTPSLAILFIALFPECLLGQDAASLAAIREGRALYSTVSVLAFDTSGRPLGPPRIKLFESEEDHSDLAGKFRDGVARGIPYGDYRIETWLEGYASDSKTVRIYGPHVSAVVGLTFVPRASRDPARFAWANRRTDAGTQLLRETYRHLC